MDAPQPPNPPTDHAQPRRTASDVVPPALGAIRRRAAVPAAQIAPGDDLEEWGTAEPDPAATAAFDQLQAAIDAGTTDPATIGPATGWPYIDPEPEQPDEPQSALERLRSHLLDGDAIEALNPPAPLVDGLLDLDSFAVMYGRPGSGKTHVALDLALRIATGTWWQKQPVTQGHVLYVVAEGAAGVGQRQLAWKALNHHHQSLNGQITWLPVAVHLLSPDNAHALATIAHDNASSLVIIDTLARSMAGGDENSYKDMSLVIDACERIRAITGACVLLIHHTGKDQTAGGRGHSSLLGAVHTELEVKNAGDGIITLATTKQKDHADTAQPWRFVLAPAAHSVAIATYAGHIPGTGADVIGKARDTLEALRAIDIPGGVTSGEWLGNSVQSGVSKSSFHIHRRSLLLTGEVQNVGSEARPRYNAVTRTYVTSDDV